MVTAPPTDLDETIWRALNAKTKPVGSLGRLETLAFQLARIQQSLQPRMETCQLTLFVADHGVATRGVSAYPQEVTRQMLVNFLAGGAASNVLAGLFGVSLQIVDAGVAGEPLVHPKLVSRRIAAGTRDFSCHAAMDASQYQEAYQAGLQIGRETATDAVAFGEMGIGNTSSAALVMHKLTGVDLDLLCGSGTGLDRLGLERKKVVLRESAQRTQELLSAERALQEYGGFETVMMTGAMIGAAERGRVVIVDGFIATSSAVAAVKLFPEARAFLVFSHRSAERGHRDILEHLKAVPLLELGLRLGEGSGALLAWPLVRAAAALLTEMASFESARVSGPS